MRTKVHYRKMILRHYDQRYFLTPACGKSPLGVSGGTMPVMTKDLAAVTCGSCKKTGVFKKRVEAGKSENRIFVNEWEFRKISDDSIEVLEGSWRHCVIPAVVILGAAELIKQKWGEK